MESNVLKLFSLSLLIIFTIGFIFYFFINTLFSFFFAISLAFLTLSFQSLTSYVFPEFSINGLSITLAFKIIDGSLFDFEILLVLVNVFL